MQFTATHRAVYQSSVAPLVATTTSTPANDQAVVMQMVALTLPSKASFASIVPCVRTTRRTCRKVGEMLRIIFGACVCIFIYKPILTHPLSWLYTFMVAIDANFKLKLKSHGYKDVELAAGYAYFVCGAPYDEVLRAHQDEEEDVSSILSLILTSSDLWRCSEID